MVLHVVPEGLAATSAAVEAIAATLAAAHASAAPLITAVVPPAMDPVSLQAAAELSMQGSQHEAVAARGTEVLRRAGVGVAAAGANYHAADTSAASAFPR
ncbi:MULTISPECIES: PE family protein [Mycobacteriaceae]|uniref:PE family protein n=2 Tax=Mycobacteriaceae TaxID=1762 RepID=F5YYX0_MYCSD|nr:MULTISPECIES: PE family protein [Mycobacteriaceae]AEF34285.1 PE family protein [Mycolicibacter sinensis]BBX12455.1 cell motility protein [Mycobacterium novum]